MSGCVRERATDDLATFHYKWWAWVCAALPPIFAGMILAKYPTTWINGAWRPWWKFRYWNYLDAIRFGGLIVLTLVAPFQLLNRVEVGPRHFQEDNALGLRATRTISWADLSRIDLKSEKPAGDWTPDKDREHKKRPDMVAVFKDGRTEEFRGWLLTGAQPEILRRAQAAGVPVVTTDDPGGAQMAGMLPRAGGAGAPPPAFARPEGFGVVPSGRPQGFGPPAGREFPPGRPRRGIAEGTR